MPNATPVGRARDDRDVVQDLARELADLAAQFASLKGEAYNWLSDESYAALRHRLENAHAAVEAVAGEARRRGRRNEGRERGAECPGPDGGGCSADEFPRRPNMRSSQNCSSRHWCENPVE